MARVGDIARQVQIDAEMWIQVEPGGEYRIHPGGGIVIAYPGHPPRWVRMENGALKSDDLPRAATMVVRLQDQRT